MGEFVVPPFLAPTDLPVWRQIRKGNTKETRGTAFVVRTRNIRTQRRFLDPRIDLEITPAATFVLLPRARVR